MGGGGVCHLPSEGAPTLHFNLNPRVPGWLVLRCEAKCHGAHSNALGGQTWAPELLQMIWLRPGAEASSAGLTPPDPGLSQGGQGEWTP